MKKWLFYRSVLLDSQKDALDTYFILVGKATEVKVLIYKLIAIAETKHK